jgi:hypothetical protein
MQSKPPIMAKWLGMIFLILTGHLILAFVVFTVIFIEER